MKTAALFFALYWSFGTCLMALMVAGNLPELRDRWTWECGKRGVIDDLVAVAKIVFILISPPFTALVAIIWALFK